MKARTSCDACHMRKTKCDLGDKTTKAQPNRNTSLSEQASCSFCISLGVPCRVTKKAGGVTISTNSNGALKTGKHKKGKIIRELLAEAAQDNPPDDDMEQGEEVGNLLAPFDSGAHYIISSFMKGKSSNSTPANNIDPLLRRGSTAATTSSSATQSRPAFMGVPGLTTAALENCLQGFFDSLNLWMPLSTSQEVFMKRFSYFLKDIQGIAREKEPGEDQDSSLSPLSELLVLAVASRGAAFTSNNRHLEKLLYDRGATLARQPDYRELEELDGLEAVALLSERFIRPLHAIPEGGKHPSCTVLDPFGKGFSAELCLSMKINEEVPTFSPDYHRRTHLFWVMFCHDALRSASACRIYRIHDEDVGLPMRIVFKNQPIIALALVARKLCRTLFSSRARCLGIEEKDINILLNDLANWPDTVNIPVDNGDVDFTSSQSSSQSSSTSWPSSLDEQSPADSDTANQHQILVKRCIAMGFWLRLSLSVWTFLNEIGYLASSNIMIRVEKETALAAIRMVKLATVCVKLNLVDMGPNALLTTSAAWVLYLIRKIGDLREADKSNSNTAASIQANCNKRKELQDMARILLMAVRNAKTRPEVESLALRLEAMLRLASVSSLSNIARLAESSTADLGTTDFLIDSRGEKRQRVDDTLPSPPLQPPPSFNIASEPTFGSSNHIYNQDSNNGNSSSSSNYLQQDQENTMMFSTISSGGSSFLIPNNGPSQINDAKAMQSLASGFPTGLSVAGDEDYLTLMASCGFDMPFSSMGVFEPPYQHQF